jgi:tRNA-dihydrouridine synthase
MMSRCRSGRVHTTHQWQRITASKRIKPGQTCFSNGTPSSGCRGLCSSTQQDTPHAQHENENQTPNQKFVSASGFYERIGQPRYVAAPMVAQSDYAFRQLCRRYGVDCAYTQMYHAKNFCHTKAFREAHLDIFPAYKFPSNIERLLENEHATPPPLESGPLIAQIAGHDPATMLQTAQTILDLTEGNVDGIDVNLGCPQTIARKGRYGAYLLREIDTVTDILSTLRQHLPSNVGVTAKIRIPDYDDAEGTHLTSVVHKLCSKGRIDLLTVHGRTLMENKTAVRQVNWDKVGMATTIAQEEYGVPVLANGGIETFANVQECLDQTGARGVMSSEALLENPGFFSGQTGTGRDQSELTVRQVMERQFKYAFEYLDLAQRYPPVNGSMGTYGSHHVVKSHTFKMLHRYLREHTDLRDELGKPQTCSASQTLSVVQQLQERYLLLPADDMDVWDALSSSNQPHASWYRRHRVAGEKKHLLNNTRKANKFMALNDKGDNNKESLTVDEKKDLLRKRIDQMKKARQSKSQSVLSRISSP